MRYSIASARAIFNADDTLARLANWIGEAGPHGRTRKDITTGFFGGHKTSSDIARLSSSSLTPATSSAQPASRLAVAVGRPNSSQPLPDPPGHHPHRVSSQPAN